jgi:hypothetical protein
VKLRILECGGLPPLWSGKLASRKIPAPSRWAESGSKLPHSKKSYKSPVARVSLTALSSEEIGPHMLARIAKKTGLKPDDLR